MSEKLGILNWPELGKEEYGLIYNEIKKNKVNFKNSNSNFKIFINYYNNLKNFELFKLFKKLNINWTNPGWIEPSVYISYNNEQPKILMETKINNENIKEQKQNNDSVRSSIDNK